MCRKIYFICRQRAQHMTSRIEFSIITDKVQFNPDELLVYAILYTVILVILTVIETYSYSRSPRQSIIFIISCIYVWNAHKKLVLARVPLRCALLKVVKIVNVVLFKQRKKNKQTINRTKLPSYE